MKWRPSQLQLELVLSLAILIVLGLAFNYVTKYVSGELEAEWAYAGFSKTNYSVRFLVLFGIAGGGIVWLLYRYARRAKLLVAMFSVLIAAVAMTTHVFFYYVIPVSVLSVISYIKIKEMRKSRRRRIKTPRFEGTVPREEIRRIVREVSMRRRASDEGNR